MSREEAVRWLSQNCKEHHTEYINGIKYIMGTMEDGWIAVLQADGDGYRPLIQAADLGHALGYCNLIEPVTVPMQEICRR